MKKQEEVQAHFTHSDTCKGVECESCGSQNGHLVKTKGGWQYSLCNNCRLAIEWWLTDEESGPRRKFESFGSIGGWCRTMEGSKRV